MEKIRLLAVIYSFNQFRDTRKSDDPNQRGDVLGGVIIFVVIIIVIVTDFGNTFGGGRGGSRWWWWLFGLIRL